jgi:hypothetical protein
LDARRTQGGARFLVVIGASGAGKSSLLKAGVLPQLARRRREWVVLPTIRSGKAPVEMLAKAIAQHLGKPDEWRTWQQTLGTAVAIDHFEELLKDLRAGDARGATVLLPIDQFEEMFTVATQSERDAFPASVGVGARSRPRPADHGGRHRALRRAGRPAAGGRACAAVGDLFAAAHAARSGAAADRRAGGGGRPPGRGRLAEA